MELEIILKAAEDRGYKVSRYESSNDGGGNNYGINSGQCENTSIVTNADGSYYNIYSSNPGGRTFYKTIQELYDSLIMLEKTGTYKGNPSNWRY